MTEGNTTLEVARLQEMGSTKGLIVLVRTADCRARDRLGGVEGFLKHPLPAVGGGDCGSFVASIATSSIKLDHVYGHAVEVLNQEPVDENHLIALTLKNLDTGDQFTVQVTEASTLQIIAP